MRASLVANGTICDLEKTKQEIQKGSFIIAIDGGLQHCHEMQIIPDLLIGDFDSCSFSLLQKYAHLHKKTFPKDKDQTDLELALCDASLAAFDQIFVYAAFGGRVDHLLGNIFILCRYPQKVFFEDERQRLFVIEQKMNLQTKKDQILSLISLDGETQSVTTKGLRWNLDHEGLNYQRMSISNQSLGSEVEIEVEGGKLLCIWQYESRNESIPVTF